jgi:hypothetical protein
MGWQDLFSTEDPMQRLIRDQEKQSKEQIIQNAKAIRLLMAGAGLARVVNQQLPTPIALLNSATRNIRPLSATLLDRYLNQEPVDAGIKDDLVEAIESSDTLAAVGKKIRAGIRAKAARDLKWAPDASHIEAVAREVVQGIDAKGVYFTEGDHDLQSVIGGAHLRVEAAVVEDGVYGVALEVSDSYDFSNNRKRFPAYDRFRTRLADLLRARDYIGFNNAWYAALRDPASGLGPPAVFASYMFAMEQAGWFKGIPWSVIVAVADEAPPAARSSGGKVPQSATGKKMRTVKAR